MLCIDLNSHEEDRRVERHLRSCRFARHLDTVGGGCAGEVCVSEVFGRGEACRGRGSHSGMANVVVKVRRVELVVSAACVSVPLLSQFHKVRGCVCVMCGVKFFDFKNSLDYSSLFHPRQNNPLHFCSRNKCSGYDVLWVLCVVHDYSVEVVR